MIAQYIKQGYIREYYNVIGCIDIEYHNVNGWIDKGYCNVNKPIHVSSVDTVCVDGSFENRLKKKKILKIFYRTFKMKILYNTFKYSS